MSENDSHRSFSLGETGIYFLTSSFFVFSFFPSAAADLIKVAMIRIDERLKKELCSSLQQYTRNGLSSWVALEERCRLVNMLHDELM